MEKFITCIHQWYSLNKRDLPWRQIKEPYTIWLSEIILQQTRVRQGLNYYLRFIEAFPTVIDLANASEDEVLKLWQGLGYYSRARNLHHSAKYIVNKLNGKFPSEYSEILKLKGIGEYTAAAIASISFNQPCAVLDGNVFRFLSRYLGIDIPIDSTLGKKEFKEIAIQLTDTKNPGMHNQAIMEFGALQCKPINPDCERCPLTNSCHAFLNKQVNSLPVKQNKTKQRNRFFNYLVLIDEEFTYLAKRTANDIWKNLYEFPLIETDQKSSIEELLMDKVEDLILSSQNKQILEITEWRQHQLSHQKIFIRFLIINGLPKNDLHLNRVNKKDIFNFAVPKPVENFINENDVF